MAGHRSRGQSRPERVSSQYALTVARCHADLRSLDVTNAHVASVVSNSGARCQR